MSSGMEKTEFPNVFRKTARRQCENALHNAPEVVEAHSSAHWHESKHQKVPAPPLLPTQLRVGG